ncbi:MAG: DUF4388 domain-containing protein, partial [Planctomycetota bacterium]
MAIQGNTKTFGLHEILQTISMNKNTGMMTIQCNDLEDRDIKRELFFQEGHLTFMADGEKPVLNFYRLLPRFGILTKEKLDQIIKKTGADKNFLGPTLVETKAIPEKILRSIVRKFYENEFFELLSWQDADFVFEMNITRESKYPQVDPLTLVSLHAERTVMEILRQLDEVEVLQKRFPSIDSFLCLTVPQEKILTSIKLNP